MQLDAAVFSSTGRQYLYWINVLSGTAECILVYSDLYYEAETGLTLNYWKGVNISNSISDYKSYTKIRIKIYLSVAVLLRNTQRWPCSIQLYANSSSYAILSLHRILCLFMYVHIPVMQTTLQALFEFACRSSFILLWYWKNILTPNSQNPLQNSLFNASVSKRTDRLLAFTAENFKFSAAFRFCYLAGRTILLLVEIG